MPSPLHSPSLRTAILNAAVALSGLVLLGACGKGDSAPPRARAHRPPRR